MVVRVKGIDEPNDNDNTWENAQNDDKKGQCGSSTLDHLHAIQLLRSPQCSCLPFQVQQLEHDSGPQSPSQSMVSQNPRMTLPTMRMGELVPAVQFDDGMHFVLGTGFFSDVAS